MDLSLKEFVQMLIAVGGGAYTAYVAIRADLAQHTAKIAALEVAVIRVDGAVKDTNQRVDGILIRDAQL